MEIRGLGNSLAAVLGQRPPVDPSGPGLRVSEVPTSEPSAGPSSPLGKILSDYDLHNITPRQFTEMLDRLKQADVITPREQQQLGQLRLELDSQGAQPDQPIDLLDYIAQKLTALRKQMEDAKNNGDDTLTAGLQATLALTDEQSKWLDKLNAARQERPPEGINAQA